MKAKILVVDDEKEISSMLCKYLSMKGYQVHGATSPVEALELIQKDNYMIVISDIVMPEMNGVEFLKQIKHFDGLIQVIMITGYITTENILEVFRHGSNNCFFKPLDNLDIIREEVDLAIAKMNRVKDIIMGLKHYK